MNMLTLLVYMREVVTSSNNMNINNTISLVGQMVFYGMLFPDWFNLLGTSPGVVLRPLGARIARVGSRRRTRVRTRQYLRNPVVLNENKAFSGKICLPVLIFSVWSSNALIWRFWPNKNIWIKKDITQMILKFAKIWPYIRL